MELGNSSAATTPSSSSGGTSQDQIFQNLYPAIIQAFAIILAGYLSGRTGMVTQTQSKGISTFVSKFALPALLLLNMIELDFSAVNWKFLCSLFLAKASVFATVLFLTLLVHRPLNLGKAALFAIFTTQSNDFAIGLPIVRAIYRAIHPEFIPYIYLAAPISLAILNPIGFLLLEIEKRRNQDTQTGSKLGLIWHVVKGVITNPIVFMVIIGIISNFIFQHNVPLVITEILKVLGDSFSATALFYLGFTLVGKVQKLKGLGLVAPCLLIAAKTLLLPFVTREMVYVMSTGSPTNETLSYSMFGFLYGTFPSAPTVLIYASSYGMAVDIISTGMVLCTFISAPLMFVSARMVTLPTITESENYKMLSETSFDISILGIVSTVWVTIVFVLGRKWRVFPHQFVVYLLMAQLLACIGSILWQVTDNTVAWQHYLQFIFCFVGVLASRTCTSAYAVGMCLLRTRSLCFVLRMRGYLILYGFGLPIVCTGLLLICSAPQWSTSDVAFQYGLPQMIISAIIIFTSLVVTVVALIIQQRNDRKHKNYETLENERDKDTPASEKSGACVGGTTDYGACCKEKQSKDSIGDIQACPRTGRSNSIEDIVRWSDMQTSDTDDGMVDDGSLNQSMCVNRQCSKAQRQECRSLLKKYHTLNSVGSEADSVINSQTKDEEIGHHLVLLFLLIVSMGIALFLCFWRLFHEDSSGLFIELEFLDCFFNFGQAFFVFAVFGLDTKLIIIPCVKRWRRLVYGAENIHLPRLEDLDEDARHVCEQFKMYHKDKCSYALQRNRRYRLRVYKNVFTGTDLVTWLQDVGLASDSTEAVIYGQQLVLGRVIHHVTDEHQFYNLPYFYRFCDVEENTQNMTVPEPPST